MRVWRLTSVCLTSAVCLTSVVAYTGPNSRTEMPRKTKIGTEVVHITRDSDTTFKVKRSPGRFTHCGLNAWGRMQRWPWERIGHGKLLLCCVCSPARELLGRPRRRRGAGHIVSPHAQLVFFILGLGRQKSVRMSSYATVRLSRHIITLLYGQFF